MDQERAEELFAAFGPIRTRRMFSGAGVYADGLCFALELRGVLYLKSDPEDAAAFEAEGCEPFAYDAKTGRRVVTSYRRAPERLLDDPDEMAVWALRALAVARKAAERKPRRRKSQRLHAI